MFMFGQDEQTLETNVKLRNESGLTCLYFQFSSVTAAYDYVWSGSGLQNSIPIIFLVHFVTYLTILTSTFIRRYKPVCIQYAQVHCMFRLRMRIIANVFLEIQRAYFKH
jgi:hypothetical protein